MKISREALRGYILEEVLAYVCTMPGLPSMCRIRYIGWLDLRDFSGSALC